MIPLAMSVLWWIFLVCLLMGLGFWMLFAWSIRSGHFDDPDQVADEMLEHDRDEFAPAETTNEAVGVSHE